MISVTSKLQFSESRAKLGGADISTMQHTAWATYIQLRLSDRKPEGCYNISYEDSEGQKQDIGLLDLITSKYIDLLSSIHELSFNVVLSSQDFEILKKKVKKTGMVFEVSVNILGPGKDADKVANILLRNRCFLQHPMFLGPGTKYINPQYFYSEDTKNDLRNLIGPATRTEAEALSRRLRDGLEDVLGSLAGQEQGIDNFQLPLVNEFLRTKLKP